jgi:hypothetical protein
MQVGQAQNLSSYFKGLAQSDINALAEKFSDDMEVCVNDVQEFMTKEEAKAAILKFLANAKPISGSELHKGSSKSNQSQYRVGQLKTANGNFRVFLYLEGGKDDFEIVSVLINPEK